MQSASLSTRYCENNERPTSHDDPDSRKYYTYECAFSTWWFLLSVYISDHTFLFLILCQELITLAQGPANTANEPKSPLVFINKVLLETASHLFTCCLWLLSHYSSRLEKLQQAPCDCKHESICYLVFYRKRLLTPIMLVLNCLNRCRGGTCPGLLSQMECWEP